MRIYPDPSIIVAAFLEEKNSDLAAEFLKDNSPGSIVVSWWTHTELTSALGVKTRSGIVAPERRRIVLGAIRDSLRRTARTVDLVARDFEVASELMERTELPLRGGDALHLATAARIEVALWTLDHKMAAAGMELGLDVHLLM